MQLPSTREEGLQKLQIVADCRQDDVNLSNNLTTGAVSLSSRSFPQSGYRVERDYRNPEVNPYVTSNPFGILVDEDGEIMASVSRLGREEGEGKAPAATVKTDRNRPVHTISRDVMASGGAQDGASRQDGLGDYDPEKVKKNRYLCHSELKYSVGDINEAVGTALLKQKHFRKVFATRKSMSKLPVS